MNYMILMPLYPMLIDKKLELVNIFLIFNL